MKGDIKGQILLSECPFVCVRCGDGDAAHIARFCVSNAKKMLALLSGLSWNKVDHFGSNIFVDHFCGIR